jgi:hypothetical protein
MVKAVTPVEPPEGAVTVTAGTVVYPVPFNTIVNPVTLPPEMIAVAVAVTPGPGEGAAIVTVGAVA